MKLIGIQQYTMIDYPGKIACVVFTPGCNFRCPFCHNPESVLPELIKEQAQDLIPENAFWGFLETRKGLLDGVSICGGEPTLHPDLYDFAQKIKNKGFLVKLDTNGRDADTVIKMVNDGILDYVAIDCKNSRDKWEITTGVPHTDKFRENYEKILNFLRDGNVEYEYRTTISKGLHDIDDIKSMAKYLKDIDVYYIQNFKPGTTLDPNFTGQSFTESELTKFQDIAGEYVSRCVIRA